MRVRVVLCSVSLQILKCGWHQVVSNITPGAASSRELRFELRLSRTSLSLELMDYSPLRSSVQCLILVPWGSVNRIDGDARACLWRSGNEAELLARFPQKKLTF